MIPGTTASRGHPISSFVLPEAAYIADFVNDIYSIDGSPVTLSDVVDDSTAGLVDGQGLFVEAGQPPISIIGSFRARVVDFNWTMVVDLDGGDPSNFTPIFAFYTLFNMPTFGYENYINFGQGWWVEDNNSDYPGNVTSGIGAPIYRYIEDFPGPIDIGLHRIGVTQIQDGSLSLAVDGRPFFTATTPNRLNLDTHTGADTHVQFGAYAADSTNSESYHIAKWQIFEPVDDDTLQALTA